MNRKTFVGLIFIFQIMFGNLCFVQIAQAVAPEGAPPISFENAKDCPWVTMSTEENPGESPCASGHCYTEPAPEVTNAVHVVHEVFAQALPVDPQPLKLVAPETENLLPEPAESPPLIVGVTTVVLKE